MKHILSCSFGKDSIATALLALQHGEPLDELVYCEVMFSEKISGELPEHSRFIHETAIPYFEQRGIPTRVLRSEKTYLSCFYHVVTRQNERTLVRLSSQRTLRNSAGLQAGTNPGVPQNAAPGHDAVHRYCRRRTQTADTAERQ